MHIVGINNCDIQTIYDPIIMIFSPVLQCTYQLVFLLACMYCSLCIYRMSEINILILTVDMRDYDQ